MSKVIIRNDAKFWLVVESVSPTAVHFSDYDGPRHLTGDAYKVMEGDIVIKCDRASFSKKSLVIVTVAMAGLKWYTARVCAGDDCGVILREYVRSWLALSRECRIIRAAAEWEHKIQIEINDYLDEEPILHTIDDEFVYSRMVKIEQLSREMAEASAPPNLINEDTIFEAFQRWLESLSTMSDVPPHDLYGMLIRGAQQTSAQAHHVDYLKKFTRALHFKDDDNE
jgi:hypothetical protein